MLLTDTALRLAKPRERAYKLGDGRGLCLLIQPNGSKWWRYRYEWHGAEKMFSLGIYPDVPLSEARDRRDAARRQLAAGINLSAQRKTEKAAAQYTFESVGRHWLAQQARYVGTGFDAATPVPISPSVSAKPLTKGQESPI
jgi:hypothetical protein